MDSPARALEAAWWRPGRGWLPSLLRPLAAVVSLVARRRRARAEASPPQPLRVPVIVVGNVIVGGAGKTPTVIALVQQLRAWGRTPGLVSRGYGRAGEVPLVIDGAPMTATAAREVGDEPLLMHRRTGAPVAVGRARREAAEHLLAAHPDIDVLVADDGLQHHALPRDVELVVFDGRGVGNGLVLPAGPLREPPEGLWPARPGAPARLVLLNGPWPDPPARALPLPAEAAFTADRALAGAVALEAWARGERADPAALEALRGRPVVAAAGIGDPRRFFAMLAARGLSVTPLPQPDHAAFDPLPWAPGTPDVVVTEKDAVKLAGRPLEGTRVWVVPLDFALDEGLCRALRAALDRADAARGAAPAAAPR